MIEIVDIKEATVVTHAGTFHADDVFATVLLEKLYGDVKVARVNEVEGALDAFVYDIGFGTYDHHQPDKAVRENGIHYSSVGLIWRDYGYEILEKMGISDLDDFWLDIDDCLFMPIDALDNGEGKREPMTISSVIAMMNPFWNSEITRDEAFLKAVAVAREMFDCFVTGLEREYAGHDIDYDAGYDWLDEWSVQAVLDAAEKADLFIYTEQGNAVDLWRDYGEDIITYNGCKAASAYNVLKACIEPLVYGRGDHDEITAYPVEAIAIVAEELHPGAGKKMLQDVFDQCIYSERSRCEGVAYVERQLDYSENHIVILENFAPWKGTIAASDSYKAKDAFLVVFPSSRGGWNFQGIPTSPGAFEVKCKVPESWLGKREDDLVEVSGIPDATFVHPEGFIGGAKSYEGIMKMAEVIVSVTLGATFQK